MFPIVFGTITQLFRATLINDTFAPPHPYSTHYAEVSRAEILCHGLELVNASIYLVLKTV